MESIAAPAAKAARRSKVPEVPRIFVYVAGLIPAAWLFFLAFTDRIGADPVAQLEWGLGLWALRFLILTLCITPLRQIFRINLLRYRRAVGLLSFYYVLLHQSVWLILDRGVDWHAVLMDIVRRPYITVGMAAFSLLLPLALTSTNWSIRKLGGKAWNRLHKLIYPAAILAAVHFIMIKKVWLIEPLVYAGIVVGLLGLRLIWSRLNAGKPSRRGAAGSR